jgi:hypothetical protein
VRSLQISAEAFGVLNREASRSLRASRAQIRGGACTGSDPRKVRGARARLAHASHPSSHAFPFHLVKPASVGIRKNTHIRGYWQCSHRRFYSFVSLELTYNQNICQTAPKIKKPAIRRIASVVFFALGLSTPIIFLYA